ncbi:MAG: deoxyribose-phosphate aldolase [Aureispira sp.]|nr:deoxyribose-phosphate aldolase [Aureispira sp.]
MNLSDFIELTLLRPDTTSEQVEQLCQVAIDNQFKAVCIPPFYVPHANKFLDDTKIRIATVVGFPMGYSTIPAKVEETKRAIDDGVHELDMVANLCAIKDGAWSHVHNDIDSVVRAAHLRGKTFKVILETGLLSADEIKRMCELCTNLGVDIVQTSTGISTPETSIEIVEFLKQNIGKEVRIKAFGNIQSQKLASQLITAGASRIGTPSGLKIISAESNPS